MRGSAPTWRRAPSASGTTGALRTASETARGAGRVLALRRAHEREETAAVAHIADRPDRLRRGRRALVERCELELEYFFDRRADQRLAIRDGRAASARFR